MTLNNAGNSAFQGLDESKKNSKKEYKNLTLAEASEIYYKNLNKFETLKIKTLAKISDDSQINSSVKEKLLNIRTKEQLRFKLEIFRCEHLRLIEDVLVRCLHYEKVDQAKIDLAKLYIEDIRQDIKGVNEEQYLIFGNDRSLNYGTVYFLLFYDLSKRGISDIFDLSKELFYKSKKRPLDFTRESMIELCDIWETYVNEHNFFHNKFMDLINSNEKNISLLYSKLSKKKYSAAELDNVIVKNILNIDSEKRSKILTKFSYNSFVISLVLEKMNAKYDFLLEYYSNKGNRYKGIQKNFIGELETNKVAELDDLKKSFQIIISNIEDSYFELNSRKVLLYGSHDVKYINLMKQLLKTYEVLYSSHIHLAKFSLNPAMARKYKLMFNNVTVVKNGKKVSMSYTEARDYYRSKVNDLQVLFRNLTQAKL